MHDLHRVALAGALAVAIALVAAESHSLPELIVLDKSKRGPVYFPHKKHTESYGVPCEKCHHNINRVPSGETSCQGCHFSPTHGGLCHECHISNRDSDYDTRIKEIEKRLGKTDIPVLFKAFHNLCRNCHAEENEKHQKNAPHVCEGCHTG